MKKILSISTKKGDSGFSYLANGEKRHKSDPIFELLGYVDELNSYIGLVVAVAKSNATDTTLGIVPQLEEVQTLLYTTSAQVAGSTKVAITKKDLTKIEHTADMLQEKMADNWTTQFLFPGGTILGAYLDIARTVCRKVERLLASFSKKQQLEPLILKYFNRLSDFLYILRCFVNQSLGVTEKKFGKK